MGSRCRVTFEPAPNATVADLATALEAWADRHAGAFRADGSRFERAHGTLVCEPADGFDPDLLLDAMAPFERARVVRGDDGTETETRWLFERRGAETVLVDRTEHTGSPGRTEPPEHTGCDERDGPDESAEADAGATDDTEEDPAVDAGGDATGRQTTLVESDRGTDGVDADA